jgi:hypothetical protein
MASLSIQTADVVIFQLIRKNLKAPKNSAESVWKEVSTFHMAVKPAVITYTEGSRSVVTQTSPNAGFLDRFGTRLMQVQMTGTFGVQPRRQGLVLKDGLTRLREFRDELFRQSQLARQQKTDGTALYVYAVNYYDFINDERCTINFDTFSRTLDARRNAFESTYQLTFTALGEPIEEATTIDPLLKVLLEVNKLFKQADTSLTSVLNNPVLKGMSEAVEILGVLGGTAMNIADLITKYGSAIVGQITSIQQGTLNSTPNEIGRIIQIKG